MVIMEELVEKISKVIIWFCVFLCFREILSVNLFFFFVGWIKFIWGFFKRYVFFGGYFYFMERDNECFVIKFVFVVLGV